MHFDITAIFTLLAVAIIAVAYKKRKESRYPMLLVEYEIAISNRAARIEARYGPCVDSEGINDLRNSIRRADQIIKFEKARPKDLDLVRSNLLSLTSMDSLRLYQLDCSDRTLEIQKAVYDLVGKIDKKFP